MTILCSVSVSECWALERRPQRQQLMQYGGWARYTLNVAYGMGKCAVDKMSADMAIEAATEAVDVVSWWPQEPLQTTEVLNGGLEGTTVRRGLPPLLGDAYAALGLRADALAHTALAGTVTWEGRVLAAFARDAGVTRRYVSQPLSDPLYLGLSLLCCRNSSLRTDWFLVGVST